MTDEQYHYVHDNCDLEIASWDGSWIRIRDITDGESILLSVAELEEELDNGNLL